MPEDLPIRYQLRKFAEVYRAFTQLAQKRRPPGPQELTMPDFQMEETVPPQLAEAADTLRFLLGLQWSMLILAIKETCPDLDEPEIERADGVGCQVPGLPGGSVRRAYYVGFAEAAAHQESLEEFIKGISPGMLRKYARGKG